MSGERQHAKGQEGAQRAKRWLEATTRVNVLWVNPEPMALPKLTFRWLTGGTFSFDLAGVLVGGNQANEEFFAECKKYDNAYDQGQLYDEYLAKCYVALNFQPSRCDHFMWITWSPFATTRWDSLCRSASVQAAVLKNSERALGVPIEEASSKIDSDVCDTVASRLWIIVLSERQEEHLVLSPEHQGLIRAHVAERAAKG